MCPPGYRHSGFVATDAPVHMVYDYTLLVPICQEYSISKARSEISSHIYIHTCTHLYMWIHKEK